MALSITDFMQFQPNFQQQNIPAFGQKRMGPTNFPDILRKAISERPPIVDNFPAARPMGGGIPSSGMLPRNTMGRRMGRRRRRICQAGSLPMPFGGGREFPGIVPAGSPTPLDLGLQLMGSKIGPHNRFGAGGGAGFARAGRMNPY